jgi:hypothetical protein
MKQFLRPATIAAALCLGTPAVAVAQSTTGNITGTADAGDTIVVESASGGLHRELKIDKDGKFTIRRLPVGEYMVTHVRADGTVRSPAQVRLNAGVTVRVE